MALNPVLRSLLAAPGPSGREAAPVGAWTDAARGFCDDVTVDVVGSAVARVPGTGDGPRLAVVGHVDEIGLVVTHVDDEGLLWFAGVGGWDPMILVGQRVELLTREGRVAGVIGKKPIHLLDEDERKKVPELKDLHIDIGARDGDDARAVVRNGDVAVISGDPLELRAGRFAARSMDNRLGAFVALEAARLVAEAGGAPGELCAVAAVQEETTFGGSRTSAFRLDPAVAIVVDVTHATDAPDVDERREGRHRLGSGAVVNRGPSLHPRVVDLLCEAAESEGIPHTVEASGGRTGTDADAVAFSRAGVPTGIVSVPLRYMHSPVEVVEQDDVLACARLVAAFARRLAADERFARA